MATAVGAQFTTQYSNTIKTPQMMLNDDWAAPPVLELGGSDIIHFSFDNVK